MHFGAFALLLLPLCVSVQLHWIAAGAGATGIGVHDGTNVGSVPAEGLVELLRSQEIGRVRLHNADSATLRAISKISRGAQIQIILGVTNEEIVDVGASPASARRWIARNVGPFFPATDIIAIAVGSEVLSSREEAPHSVVQFLLPAMENLYAALSEVGWEKRIKVSAPQSARVLSSYFPPSLATFNGGVSIDRAIAPLLEFLASSGSFLMVNLYPQDLQLDVVAGLKTQQPEFAVVGEVDGPQLGRHHSSRVDVLIDSVAVAMASLGYRLPSVMGIEMEWSSASSSNAFRTDRITRGLAVDIDSRFVEDFLSSPTLNEKKVVRAEAFSSRRFLVDPLQAKQQPEESGKRRRLANKSWCVAKPDASTTALQSALDWACGTGQADCSAIQSGQSCFLPDEVAAHASYAFNSYYQRLSWASASCDFGGIAEITTTDPSTPACLYTSSTSADGTPSTPTGTIVPSSSSSSRRTWDRCRYIFTSFILIFLVKRGVADFEL